MALYKRGSIWWSYFYLDGVRYQQSTETGSRKQAEAIERKLKEEAVARRYALVELDPHLTVSALIARFIASGSARPHHLYHFKFLLPFFGDYAVLRLTKPLAEEFRRQRKARPCRSAIKDATINRDLSVLRHVLYWAVDERLLQSNPLARLKLAPERRIRRQILSLPEEAALLSAAAEHLRPMIMAALDTGMRRGEITAQQWGDVDLARRVIAVTRSKTAEGEGREIPLTERLYDWLAAHAQREGIVFGYGGSQVRIIKRAWKTALKNAGIRHVRFHDLRHCFATRLMEAGVLQDIRMALMGHASGAKIHATYTHIELPAKRKAIAALEAWVNQQRQQLKEDSHACPEDAATATGPAEARGS